MARIPKDQVGALTKKRSAQFEPSNRRRLSTPGLRTFLAIADLWGLELERRLPVLGYSHANTLRCLEGPHGRDAVLSVRTSMHIADLFYPPGILTTLISIAEK
jgi:hypothetical protein